MRRRNFLFEDTNDEIELYDLTTSLVEDGNFEELYEEYGNDLFSDTFYRALVDGTLFDGRYPDNIRNVDEFFEEYRPTETEVLNSKYMQEILIEEAKNVHDYSLSFNEIYENDNYYNSRDLSLEFLESLFSGEVADWFFDNYYDYVDNSEAIDLFCEYASQDNISFVRALPIWKDNQLDLNKLLQEENVEDEDGYYNLITSIKSCASDAYASGSANEAIQDFEAELGGALPDGVTIEGSGGSSLRTLNINMDEFINNFSSMYYHGNNAKEGPQAFIIDLFDELMHYYVKDAVGKLIVDKISDKFRLREPSYGWNGFDTEVFKDSLDWRVEDDLNYLIRN